MMSAAQDAVRLNGPLPRRHAGLIPLSPPTWPRRGCYSLELNMKKWKLLQLVGVLALLTGVAIRVSGEFYGMHLALVGVLCYAIGRVAAWLKSDQP
jgi:hypothetical protein